MFKIYDGREKFYQWDLDRQLIVEDPSITEVHFCNRTDNCSLVCETYVEDGLTLVNVPNILLQTDWRIHVFAYDGKYTKHDECYEVKSRTKPSDYVYTETEIKNWEDVEKIANEAKETADRASEDVLALRNQLEGKADASEVLALKGSIALQNITIENMQDDLEELPGAKTADGGEIFNLYENTKYKYNGISVDVDKNAATGKYAHAEGVGTKATGDGSHAEGVLTTAYGVNSHAEGGGTNALGVSSHAEGLGLTFDCDAYKKEYTNGKQYLYVKTVLDVEGVNQLSSVRKNNVIWIETSSTNHTGSYYIIQGEAEYSASDVISGILNGYKIELDKQLPSDWTVSKSATKKVTIMMGAACAIASHTEGKGCVTVDLQANKLDATESDKQRQHAEGSHTLASGYAAHSEGQYTVASGDRAHAEGDTTEASGLHSHAEGHKTVSSAREAHAEGNGTTASGEQAHAEGLGTTASGNQAHAEGNGSKATNVAAHAEGENTEAVSKASHSEGSNTRAYNYGAHAEGRETWAKGNSSHAEGLNTVADKVASHAEGRGTIANREGQHVEGTYNIANDNFLHILGNGDSDTARSNAHTIDTNGNAWFAGGILLTTPDGKKKYKITIDNNGNLTTTLFTEY